MSVYLSSYWKKNILVGLVINFMIIISSIVFCAWSNDKEDYVLVSCSLFFVLLLSYLMFLSMKLIRYVTIKNQDLIMCSFYGKQISSINLESDVYYEILPLIEGTYSRASFIIISNTPFVSYRERGFTGLMATCKSLDANGNQVIMPYKDQYTLNIIGRLQHEGWKPIS